MQEVPALRAHPVAPQLVEARRAPDVGIDLEIVAQQIGGGDDLAQDRPAPHQLDPRRLSFRALLQQVEALDDPRLGAFGHPRVRVVLVHQRHVVVAVLLLLVHPPDAFADDHDDLERERRIVRDAVRDRRREDVAVTVLVLQALAVQRRAARRAAQQEAPRAHVAGGPREIAHALQSEHRVVDVERESSARCSCCTRSPRRSTSSSRPPR